MKLSSILCDGIRYSVAGIIVCDCMYYKHHYVIFVYTLYTLLSSKYQDRISLNFKITCTLTKRSLWYTVKYIFPRWVCVPKSEDIYQLYTNIYTCHSMPFSVILDRLRPTIFYVCTCLAVMRMRIPFMAKCVNSSFRYRNLLEPMQVQSCARV